MATPAVIEIIFQGDTSGVEKATDDIKGKVAQLGGVGKLAGLALAGGITAGATAAAAGVAAAGKAWFDYQNQADAALGQVQAQLGVTRAEAEAFGETGKEVFANNWGESIGEATTALATFSQAMQGTATQGELQTMTESAFALRDAFGIELEESARAATAAFSTFGTSGAETMDILAAATQRIGPAADDLVDTFDEYSTVFARAGFSAEEMGNMLVTAVQAGAWNTDVAADAVKEFGIRIADATYQADEALAILPEAAHNVKRALEEGSITGSEAMRAIAQSIAEIDDQQRQTEAGVIAFGTKFEDVGIDAVLAMTEASASMGNVEGAALNAGNAVNDTIGAAFEQLKRTALTALAELGSGAWEPLRRAIIDTINVLGSSIEKAVGHFEHVANVARLTGDILRLDFAGAVVDTAATTGVVSTEMASVLTNNMGQILGTAQVVMEGVAHTHDEGWSHSANIMAEALGFMQQTGAQRWTAIAADVLGANKYMSEGVVRPAWETIANLIIDASAETRWKIAQWAAGMVQIVGKAMLQLLRMSSETIDGIINKIEQLLDFLPEWARDMLGNFARTALEVGIDAILARITRGMLGVEEAANAASRANERFTSSVPRFEADEFVPSSGTYEPTAFNFGSSAPVGVPGTGAEEEASTSSGRSSGSGRSAEEEAALLAKLLADTAIKVATAIQTGLDALGQLTDGTLPDEAQWRPALTALETFISESIQVFERIGLASLERLGVVIEEGQQVMEAGPIQGIMAFASIAQSVAGALVAISRVDLSGVSAIAAEDLAKTEANIQAMIDAAYRLTENFRNADEEALQGLGMATSAWAEMVGTAATALSAGAAVRLDSAIAIEDEHLAIAERNATKLVDAVWRVSENFRNAEAEPLHALQVSIAAWGAVLSASARGLDAAAAADFSKAVALTADTLAIASANATALVDAAWTLAQNFINAQPAALDQLILGVGAWRDMIGLAADAIATAVAVTELLEDSVELNAAVVQDVLEHVRDELVPAITEVVNEWTLGTAEAEQLRDRLKLFSDVIAAAVGLAQVVESDGKELTGYVKINAFDTAAHLEWLSTWLVPALKGAADRWNEALGEMGDVADKLSDFENVISAAVGLARAIRDDGKELTGYVEINAFDTAAHVEWLSTWLVPALKGAADRWNEALGEMDDVADQLQSFGSVLAAAVGVARSVASDGEKLNTFIEIDVRELEEHLEHIQERILPVVKRIAGAWARGVSDMEETADEIGWFADVVGSVVSLYEGLPTEEMNEIIEIDVRAFETHLEHLQQRVLPIVQRIARAWSYGVSDMEAVGDEVSAFADVTSSALGLLSAVSGASTINFAATLPVVEDVTRFADWARMVYDEMIVAFNGIDVGENDAVLEAASSAIGAMADTVALVQALIANPFAQIKARDGGAGTRGHTLRENLQANLTDALKRTARVLADAASEFSTISVPEAAITAVERIAQMYERIIALIERARSLGDMAGDLSQLSQLPGLLANVNMGGNGRGLLGVIPGGNTSSIGPGALGVIPGGNTSSIGAGALGVIPGGNTSSIGPNAAGTMMPDAAGSMMPDALWAAAWEHVIDAAGSMMPDAAGSMMPDAAGSMMPDALWAAAWELVTDAASRLGVIPGGNTSSIGPGALGVIPGGNTSSIGDPGLIGLGGNAAGFTSLSGEAPANMEMDVNISVPTIRNEVNVEHTTQVQVGPAALAPFVDMWQEISEQRGRLEE